jgi:hypothetical protein
VVTYVYAAADWEAEFYKGDSFYASEGQDVKEATAVAAVLLSQET